MSAPPILEIHTEGSGYAVTDDMGEVFSRHDSYSDALDKAASLIHFGEATGVVNYVPREQS